MADHYKQSDHQEQRGQRGQNEQKKSISDPFIGKDIGSRFYLLSLGCAKNLVDSESMSQILKNAGYEAVEKPESADFLIVNTCGFIGSAKEEAIAAILDLATYKKGKASFLVVTGCLPQRYAKNIKETLPEVDAVLGTADYGKIAEIFEQLKAGQTCLTLPGPGGSLEHLNIARTPSTPGHFAYVKIAEGCSNHCSYCAIPGIRGPYHSRPFEIIIQEARQLAESGYRELILIAQDTTRYGLDLYGSPRISELLEAVCAIENVAMVRLLYVYPDSMTNELIDMIASQPKVAPYLDMPIQHASDAILQKMNRRDTAESMLALIKKLRERIPGLVLRSTVMVGFPGETAADQKSLLSFLKQAKFDRLGCFIFSPEEDTPAYHMKPRVRKQTAENRYQAVMKLQKEITQAANQKRVGEVVSVTLESIDDLGIFYLGRSYGEAPEVDPVIFVAATDPGVEVGQTVQVRLVEASDYDFTGVTI